ncbi:MULTISPECIES: TetR/AcrR family transcriptional regulator [unclassified Frigoribacterium]|uniref:TetR/AcrR family transcriptional regulator n=1 Tax=unclassified Frigoribacterium TaxID=2627005 RepID=UPI000F906D47|nr:MULTISPECIES: TetR/AcrR family transcriptional regulator [unclassified Frigoribacterium]ROS53564.1 TetR family transcriptional regulator [Frigoribacterium sp. PhB118]
MSPRPSARESMLDTFETLVVDDGERAATFDAVAAAAGVSKGGLLYHFPTREALVDALVDRLTALLDDDVAAMTSAPEGVVDYFVRTSSPAAIPADDPLDRCITAVSNLAASGRHPRALEALTAMQSRWHQVVLDAVGDPAVARVVSLVSDGLYFTPRPFSPVDSGGDPRHDTSIDDVIAVLQRLVPRR